MMQSRTQKQLLRLLRYAPHKRAEILKLRAQIVRENNAAFSQSIMRFRKKQASGASVTPSPVGAERRALGVIGALSLRVPTLARDSYAMRGRFNPSHSQTENIPKSHGTAEDKRRLLALWQDTESVGEHQHHL
jgi:hypothetical protein